MRRWVYIIVPFGYIDNMSESNWFPWVLGAVLVGVLLAALFLPPEWLDIRPDREDPVANAGPDLTVSFAEVTVLDGSASTDDKGIKDYVWKVENGAETVFLHGARIEFLFGAPGEYRATLTVTDNADKEDNDEVVITVLNGTS